MPWGTPQFVIFEPVKILSTYVTWFPFDLIDNFKIIFDFPLSLHNYSSFEVALNEKLYQSLLLVECVLHRHLVLKPHYSTFRVKIRNKRLCLPFLNRCYLKRTDFFNDIWFHPIFFSWWIKCNVFVYKLCWHLLQKNAYFIYYKKII